MKQIAAHRRPVAHPAPAGSSRHLARRSGLIALISLLLASALAGPAEAAKKAEPAQTGIVERLDTIGGHVIEPTPLDVGGVTLPILTVIGWDAATADDEGDDGFGAHCDGQPPVFNGVEQFLETPSGNVRVVVHNADIPVLLFDVTGVNSPEEFYEACAAGELTPLAQGTVKQRPIVHADDDGFTVKVKSRGVVTDATGQDWQLQAFFRQSVDFETGDETVDTWVTLREL